MTVHLQELAEEVDGVWWLPPGLSLEDEEIVGPCVVSLVGGEGSRFLLVDCVIRGNWGGVWVELGRFAQLAPLGSLHAIDISFTRCRFRGVSFVACGDVIDMAARSTRIRDVAG